MKIYVKIYGENKVQRELNFKALCDALSGFVDNNVLTAYDFADEDLQQELDFGD